MNVMDKLKFLSTRVLPAWECSELYWADVRVWLQRTRDEIQLHRASILNILLIDQKLHIIQNGGYLEIETRVWGDSLTSHLLDTLWLLNWALKLRNSIPEIITSVSELAEALTNNTFEIDPKYKEELEKKTAFLIAEGKKREEMYVASHAQNTGT